ncbi:MAG: DnaD domain protein, partial [Clostridia bacterium]|nr:DnaD domain protein [Clostridia bacterium]
RYWERRGLVHRISDRPPTFRYVNAKKLMFMEAPNDPVYDAFGQAVHGLFDNKRKLYGKEVSRCYEWVEQMGLPQEVVLRLLEKMIEQRGAKFSFDSAEKRAVELAEAGAKCAEDVDVVLDRDKKVVEGSRAVLRKFSMFREPTQPEMNLYRKWLVEWGFDPEAILAACEDTTNGKPSFKYLDGVLRDRREKIGTKKITAQQLEKNKQQREDVETPLRRLLATLNKPGLTVNDSTMKLYTEMRTLYGDEIILMAGKECAKRACDLDDVLKTLKNWKNKNGLTTVAQIEEYMAQVGRYDALVEQLYSVWGKTSRSSAANRALVQKWTEEWDFNWEMVVYCAAFAKDADKPMPYLNKLLDTFRQEGVLTPEAAAAAHEKVKPAAKAGKVVREQQYEQRQYEENQQLPEWMQQRLKEMNGDA